MNYDLLSRHRSALMGISMILVLMFHVASDKAMPLYALLHLGDVGVDMFLFLSGIGLWFSWTKDSSLLTFYRKRLLRILPASIIVFTLYHIPAFLEIRFVDLFDMGKIQEAIANKNVTFSNIAELIANILTGFSFWRAGAGLFWFIPAILAMYMFAPFYMELIRRHPDYRGVAIVAMIWAAMVHFIPTLQSSIGHLSIFWDRIPIFLIGLNYGERVKEHHLIESSTTYMLIIICAMSLWLGVRGKLFSVFIVRMIYIPLSISILLLMCRLFLTHTFLITPIYRFFAFVGSISLEVYLVHEHFVLGHLIRLGWGYLPTLLMLIIISLPTAWLLKKSIDIVKVKIINPFCIGE